MNIEDLKIEFRAVPYSMNYRALEFRISPDQDLTYTKEVSWLFGLIKFKTKRKYSTKWIRLNLFTNRSISYLYSIENDFNYMPVLISSAADLGVYKYEYPTYGALMKYINNRHQNELRKYYEERKRYERNQTILY